MLQQSELGEPEGGRRDGGSHRTQGLARVGVQARGNVYRQDRGPRVGHGLDKARVRLPYLTRGSGAQ